MYLHLQVSKKGRSTTSRRRILLKNNNDNRLSNGDMLDNVSISDSKNEMMDLELNLELNESYECPTFSAEKRRNYDNGNNSRNSLHNPNRIHKEFDSVRTYDDRPVQYKASIRSYEENEKLNLSGDEFANFDYSKNDNMGFDYRSFKNKIDSKEKGNGRERERDKDKDRDNEKDEDKEKEKEKEKERGRVKGRERQIEKEKGKGKGRVKDIDDVKVKIKVNGDKNNFHDNTIIKNVNENKVVNKNNHINITDDSKDNNNNVNNDNNINNVNNDINNENENESNLKVHPHDISKLLGKMRKNKRRMSFPRQSSTESLDMKSLSHKDDVITSSNRDEDRNKDKDRLINKDKDDKDRDVIVNRGRRAASEVTPESRSGSVPVSGLGSRIGTGTGTGQKSSLSSPRVKPLVWTPDLDSRFLIKKKFLYFNKME